LSAKTTPGTGTNPELAFKIEPSCRTVFRSRAYSIAERRLRVRLEEGFDTVLLVGEAGSGRTALLSALVADLGSTVPVAHLERPPSNGREALDRWGEVTAVAAGSPQVVVIIDDADHLPIDMLVAAHGARLTEGGVRVQFVLGIMPSAHDRLWGMAAHMDDAMTSCTLGGLEEDEVTAYVAHRLAVAGADPKLFTQEALTQVAACARGIPRLINLVCAKACFVSQMNHEARVSAAAVEEAAFVLRLGDLPAVREATDGLDAVEARSAA
jgi:general secretion pathway protein A